MKAICRCGFTFHSEFTQCTCPICGADITLILGVDGYGGSMTPAIVSRFYVRPSPGGDPDKIWMSSATGEAGDFSRTEFEAALGASMAAGAVNEMLDLFFWENF